MILLVDRRAFHLQEEPFFALAQQRDRFIGHCRQRRHAVSAFRVRSTGHGRLINIAVIRGFWTFPAHRHIAIREQSQQRFVLIRLSDCCQSACIAHQLIATSLCLLTQRFTLPFARRRSFCKGFRPTAQRDVSACIQQLFSNRAFAPFFQGVGWAFFTGHRRAVALT